MEDMKNFGSGGRAGVIITEGYALRHSFGKNVGS